MLPAGTGPVKVLLVDDEKGILQSLSRLLCNERYEVLTATSGEEGLDILKKTEDVGVIVSDQIMPEMKGIEFLRKAWELAPDAVRIMLTGHGGLNVEHEALYKGGAYRYIAKPWKNDELIQTLRDAVTIYSLIRENRRLTSLLHSMSRENAERLGDTAISNPVV